MKRMVLVATLGMFVCTDNLSAMGALRNRCVNFGQFLENSKLANLLPVAIVAASFQQCPGQTMAVLAGLVAYALSYNERICELFEEYKTLGLAQFGINQNKHVDRDEQLFVFDDGDEYSTQDEYDAQDEEELVEELEEELLDDSMMFPQEEYAEILRNHKIVWQQPSVSQFL